MKSIGFTFAIAVLAAATASAEIKIVHLGGSILPRESENNPAFRGDSWEGAATNWMTLLRTKSPGPIGNGRTQAVLRWNYGSGDEIVTSTSFNLWQGTHENFPPAPTKEWGNFWHSAIHVTATGGSTFRPQDVTYRMQSFVRNTSGEYVPGSIDRTIVFSQLNYFRQVLTNGVDGIPGTGDDQVSATQNPAAQVTNFLYGGAGFAFTASGAGDDTPQEKINGTGNNWWDKDYKMVYTVTVNPSGEGSPTVLTFEVGKQPAVVEADNGVLRIVDTVPGRIYTIQNSPTLSNWQPMQTFAGDYGTIVIPMPHLTSEPPLPRMFYRIDY